MCDNRIGRRALHAASGTGLWIGRPCEWPASRPLELEPELGPDCGGLEEWARENVVKVLAFCHPNDDADMRAGQEAVVKRLYTAARRNSLEFLLAMENEDYCDSLLVTEVFTPAGHWSSYPSHRHHEDDYPRITYLEETYYHPINPAQGFGVQRVYTDDGRLDETMAVADGDVVVVPRGHHPCGAPYGFDMYYLNVMAGPLRKWRFVPDPAVTWIRERDR